MCTDFTTNHYLSSTNYCVSLDSQMIAFYFSVAKTSCSFVSPLRLRGSIQPLQESNVCLANRKSLTANLINIFKIPFQKLFMPLCASLVS